jgi:hypothetical protein
MKKMLGLSEKRIPLHDRHPSIHDNAADAVFTGLAYCVLPCFVFEKTTN